MIGMNSLMNGPVISFTKSLDTNNNMEQPIVTFFIPCYNVVTCVEHCINSMLQPSIMDKIEILAINDGSKDETSALLHRYESQYPLIIRVIDKENGGWGTAVNLAIQEARGKYFKEVDADDWVETENLPQYVHQLEMLNCDYIATEYKDYQKTTQTYHPHTFQKEIYGAIYTIDAFWNQFPKGWAFPIHAITYRTQFIRDINLKVGDRYYSDFEYFLYSMPYIKDICVLPLTITIYFRGDTEQSTGVKGYRKNYKDFVDLSQRLVNFYHQIPEIHSTLRENIKYTIKGTIDFSYELLMSPIYAGKNPSSKKDLKIFDTWLKENDATFYHLCGKNKKHGIPYILLWRILNINILKAKITSQYDS